MTDGWAPRGIRVTLADDEEVRCCAHCDRYSDDDPLAHPSCLIVKTVVAAQPAGIGEPMMTDERLMRLIDAGQRLAGQAETWAICFHQEEKHYGTFERCGNGACRSTQNDLADWEQAAGAEGHNWVASRGRMG